MGKLRARERFKQEEHLAQIEELLNGDLLKPGSRVFMIGIAGISMKGLAELANAQGLVVAGSDPGGAKLKAEFKELGIEVFTTQEAKNLESFKPDFVVYSLAVPEDNPERRYAAEQGLVSIERAVFLGALNRLYKRVINIAGTNGKTTTTALCAKLLIASELDPTVHLGAELADFRGTVRIGEKAQLMLSEACEFGGSFLSFRSTSAIVLNLAHDHVDIFPEFSDVLEVFADFCLSLEAGAALFLPNFEPAVLELLELIKKEDPEFFRTHQLITYGYSKEVAEAEQIPHYLIFNQEANFEITALDFDGPFPKVKLKFANQELGFNLRIPGRFNVENAVAAFALAQHEGADPQILATEIENFTGAEGRFTYCGEFKGAKIIADYAHHADSLIKTIETAKLLPHKALKVYFQPITYTRAKANVEGYVKALSMADEANLLEVYDNREKDHSFSTKEIVERLRKLGFNSHYFPDPESAKLHAMESLNKGDLALFIGQSIRFVANDLVGRKDHHERPELRI